jgi:hypothetical protein
MSGIVGSRNEALRRKDARAAEISISARESGQA